MGSIFRLFFQEPKVITVVHFRKSLLICVIGILTDFSLIFVVFLCNSKNTNLDAIVCAHGLLYFIWKKCWVIGIYRHFQPFFSAARLIWERKVSTDMMNWPLKHMALSRCLKALTS